MFVLKIEGTWQFNSRSKKITGNESIRYPTAGLAKMYRMGKNEVMNPMTSGEIPSSLPNTLVCGNIGPIARRAEQKQQKCWIIRTKTSINAIVLLKCEIYRP